jgi:alkanesulfonate monooxygenase SsuD/methylene tetrahydromethanopterin reductase-like flavin-dependent oxidoreductase (luciferase family)
VKLGISLPMFTADVGRPLAAAAGAAASGYEGVFAPDHLFPPGAPDRPALEPYTMLAAIAALHPGLYVGTLVTRASLRPVGLLAKQAASLDHMSRGRALLGLGAGDAVSKPEHETFGIPFAPAAERVAILEETVRALRALFEGGSWDGGAYVPAIAGPLLPAGHPELWIGGRSEPVLAVAARVADAWNGWAMDADSFDAAVTTLRRLSDGRAVAPTWGGIVLVGEDDRDLERLRGERRTKGLPMDVWQGTVEDLRSFASGLEETGCAWMIVLPVGGDDRIELVAATLGAGTLRG